MSDERLAMSDRDSLISLCCGNDVYHTRTAIVEGKFPQQVVRYRLRELT